MAKGINKVILIGNLGADPEVRYLPSGGAVTNINIATAEIRKDRESGENKEHTEWHRIVFFNRLAEVAGQYLRKGSKIYLEGRLRTRKWQDKNGQERYTTEIWGDEMQMLDSKSSSGESPSSSFDRPMGNNLSDEAFNASKSSGGASSNASSNGFTDDIPF